jgi:hypothetical protein
MNADIDPMKGMPGWRWQASQGDVAENQVAVTKNTKCTKTGKITKTATTERNRELRELNELR